MTKHVYRCLGCSRDWFFFSDDLQPVQIPCIYCGAPAESKS